MKFKDIKKQFIGKKLLGIIVSIVLILGSVLKKLGLIGNEEYNKKSIEAELGLKHYKTKRDELTTR